MGGSRIDTSLINAAGGLPQAPNVNAARALATAPDPGDLRLQQIEQQLAAPLRPNEDQATRRMQEQALKSEREIILADKEQRRAVEQQRLQQQNAPSSQALAAAAPGQGDDDEAPPAPGQPRMVDPGGGDSALAQDQQQLEQLAMAEAANPAAVLARGRGSSAVVPVGGNVTTQQTLPTEAEAMALGDLEAARRRQAELDAHQVEREVAGAQRVAEVESEKARIAQQQVEEQRLIQQQTNDEVQKRMQRFDQALDDYNKTGDKVDGNRLWANASTGSKIVAGIGIMLSGIGQGLAGGENLALRQINAAIDRDLQAQQLAIQAKARGIDVAQNAVGVAIQAGASRADAVTATRGAMLESAKQKVIALQAATVVPTKQEALERVKVNLDQQIATTRLELAQSMRQTVQSSVQSRRVVTGGGAVTTGDAAERARNVLGAVKFNAANFVPELGRQYEDPAHRKEVREQLQAIKVMDRVADTMQALRKKHGANWIERVGRAQADVLAKQLTVSNLKVNSLGSLDKGAQEVSEAMSTGGDNPLDVLSTASQRVDTLKQINKIRRQALAEQGLVPDRIPAIQRNQMGQQSAADDTRKRMGGYY